MTHRVRRAIDTSVPRALLRQKAGRAVPPGEPRLGARIGIASRVSVAGSSSSAKNPSSSGASPHQFWASVGRIAGSPPAALRRHRFRSPGEADRPIITVPLDGFVSRFQDRLFQGRDGLFLRRL
jgi:hypothetical protein